MPNRTSRPTSSVFASARAAALSLACAAGVAFAPAAEAQGGNKTIIRDAEIEALLRDYAGPIFAAAGVSSRDADVVLVLNREFNAFVASGRRMVVHTGVLIQAKAPNEVIGVLAHETGHLAGGHLERLRDEVARAQAIGAVLGALGMAGMVAGAMAGADTGTRMGAAAVTVGPGMAERSLLSYRRAQELAADRAALSYLTATHQSAKGMVATFERFADQELFSARYADPYAQTHPMPRDRLQQLERAARESPYWDKTDSDQLQLRHDMMRAKLSGFTESASMVGRRFPASDKSMPAQYARAIVAYRTGGARQAISAVDGLIARAPAYPYFHELKGQILLESGKAREAIAPLRQAEALAPDAGLIRIMLGHALLQTGDAAQLDDAVANLIAGLHSEPLASDGYRHLATAYQRQGKVAEAELQSAEGLLIEGDIDNAKNFARRAQAKFSRGSPGWLKADDIINYESPTGSTKGRKRQ
jgi:predicted Zn-dependent protease